MKHTTTNLIPKLNNLELPLVTFAGYPCEIVFSRYSANGNICIQLLAAYDDADLEIYKGEHIVTATTNLSSTDKPLSDTMVCIKDWSENRGMSEALVDAGILDAAPVGQIVSCQVTAQIYLLKPVLMLLANETNEGV